MSVAEVLALPVFRRARPQVLAGDGELHRPVRWAHVFDLTDITGLLRGGELVLSTGAPLGNDPNSLTRFIDQLADEGAAALGIELGGTFSDELPQPVIDRARQRSLPLFVFRRRVRFVELTEAIHRALVDHDNDLRRRGDPLYRRIDEVAIQGGGAQELIDELTDILKNPVILEDSAGQLVAFSTRHNRPDHVIEALRGARYSNDKSGMIAADVLRHGGYWGQLIAFELDESIDFPIAHIAMQRTAVMISLCLAREHLDSVARAQTRGKFLADLSNGVFADESSAEECATALGANRARQNLIPIALAWRRDNWVTGGWNDLLRRLTHSSRGEPPLLVGQVGNELFVIIADSDTRSTERSITRVVTACQELFSGKVVIARGPTAESWTKLGLHLRQTAITALTAQACSAEQYVDARTPNADWLLYEIARSREATAYADTILEPLVRQDRKQGADLLNTLALYLRSGQSKTTTAARLNLNRQSLYGRLHRITEILKVDISNPDVAFALELAVRIKARMATHDDPKQIS